MINGLATFIISELRNCVPSSFITSKSNVSTHTVSRIFNLVQYDKPTSLAKVLAGGEKYQYILVYPKKKSMLDILSDRKQNHPIDYFNSYSKHECLKVQFLYAICGRLMLI